MTPERSMTEKESLELITDMIQKAKGSINENGWGAILWGAVVGICGIAEFARRKAGIELPFDIWLLTLLALIPNAVISQREAKAAKMRSHAARAIDTVWMVYGISVFALVLYFTVIGSQTDRLLLESGIEVFSKKVGSNTYEPMALGPLSPISLLILLFAIPTLITGLTRQFRPMTIAAVICYALFVVSLFTNTAIDNLLAGISAIINWLIPGIMLRRKYLRQHNTHV